MTIGLPMLLLILGCVDDYVGYDGPHDIYATCNDDACESVTWSSADSSGDYAFHWYALSGEGWVDPATAYDAEVDDLGRLTIQNTGIAAGATVIVGLEATSTWEGIPSGILYAQAAIHAEGTNDGADPLYSYHVMGRADTLTRATPRTIIVPEVMVKCNQPCEVRVGIAGCIGDPGGPIAQRYEAQLGPAESFSIDFAQANGNSAGVDGTNTVVGAQWDYGDMSTPLTWDNPNQPATFTTRAVPAADNYAYSWFTLTKGTSATVNQTKIDANGVAYSPPAWTATCGTGPGFCIK